LREDLALNGAHFAFELLDPLVDLPCVLSRRRQADARQQDQAEKMNTQTDPPENSLSRSSRLSGVAFLPD